MQGPRRAASLDPQVPKEPASAAAGLDARPSRPVAARAGSPRRYFGIQSLPLGRFSDCS